MYFFGLHTITCDPSNVDQLVLVRTRASFYKKCTDQVLSKIMVRMGGSYSIDIQSVVEVLRKALPERNNVDRHMVYNVRLRERRHKLKLEADNVVDLVYQDYKSNSDNYSKGEFHLASFMLIVFDNLINIFCIIIDYRITLCFSLLFLYPCCL